MAVKPHGDKPAWRLITNQLTTFAGEFRSGLVAELRAGDDGRPARDHRAAEATPRRRAGPSAGRSVWRPALDEPFPRDALGRRLHGRRHRRQRRRTTSHHIQVRSSLVEGDEL